MSAERSAWALGVAVLVVGLLAASFTLPWFTYTFSTGTESPPDGPRGAQDESVVRDRLVYRANAIEGNATLVQDSGGPGASGRLQALLIGAAASATLLVVLEGLGFFYGWVRWWSLLAGLLSLGVNAFLLWFAWFELYPTLSWNGVDGPFTGKAIEDGYVRTNLDWGWIVAGIAFLLHFGYLGFRYASGSLNLEAIDAFRRRPTK